MSAESNPTLPTTTPPCAEDPELFYPRRENNPRDLQVIEAKKWCGQCAVRYECLEKALEHNERRGIWGGLTPDERSALAARIISRSA